MTRATIKPIDLPTDAVLASFGVTGAAQEALDGGGEVSVRVDDVVLKRVHDVDVSGWTQQAIASLEPRGWRVPAPRSAIDGSWVVDGWTATEFIDGLRPLTDQVATVVGIGREISELLADRTDEASESIRRRADRWSIADRVAWREQDTAQLRLERNVLDLVERLSSHCTESVEATFIVHGDLASNVFLDASGTPVVLDFSPYVRPARYGPAIVVVDHMLWFAGSSDLRSLVGDDDDALARALIFRIVADRLGVSEADDHGVELFMATVEGLGL